MKSPDKNQFEKNAHAFNKKLAIFVGADVLLLLVATVAFLKGDARRYVKK